MDLSSFYLLQLKIFCLYGQICKANKFCIECLLCLDNKNFVNGKYHHNLP